MKQEIMGVAVASGGYMQPILTSLHRQITMPAPSLIFYRPDALPDAQPTVTHVHNMEKKKNLSPQDKGTIMSRPALGHLLAGLIIFQV